MEYKFFDKRFLVMPDDENVIGKKVFYNDNFSSLISEVERGNASRTDTLSSINVDDDEAYCFDVGCASWQLAYYDPNYECKVAFSQGKQIQVWSVSNIWEDVALPHWHEGYMYRVKPDTWYVHPSTDEYGNCIGHPFYKDKSNKTFVSFEGTEEECDAWIAEHTQKTRRYTNRELARWLAEGNGERLDVVTKYVSVNYVYAEGEDNEACDEDIRICEWDSDEWHEPLVEVKK